jgi:acetylornithine deacetylase/succinyl-diaminopimelate desuccinylase-like protein
MDQAVHRRHSERLECACAILSRQRAPLFVRPYFEGSIVRETSVKLVSRDEGRGPFFLVAFYTVPGEEKADVCRQLEHAVSEALGADAALYDLSYRQPWFEPALIDGDSPIVRLMSDSFRAVRGCPPVVTVVSKQDVFVLNNHAHIPTVSFGVAQSEGPRTHHQPDEAVSVEDVWTGARIAFEAIRRWMES